MSLAAPIRSYIGCNDQFMNLSFLSVNGKQFGPHLAWPNDKTLILVNIIVRYHAT